jgi:hypothetical protein
VPSLAKVLIENDTTEIIDDITSAFSFISCYGKEAIPFIL